MECIPRHGRLWDNTSNIADKLYSLLCEEALTVCEGKEEVYVLLSGGLDSRVLAGILADLHRQGKLPAKPMGVTWGLDDSRDVHYARAVARICGFDWQHISIGPESIMDNIVEGFPLVAGLVPPLHLHRMLWFKCLVACELVLAGSYGDSIGRGEFSGRHVLELDYLCPTNPYNLICREQVQSAARRSSQICASLLTRAGDVPKYVRCEYEMQCHYMRGEIAQAASIISRFCSFYQMFTSPAVYGYMWSLHPARRDDDIYAALLEQLSPELARLPWARTNQGCCAAVPPEQTVHFAGNSMSMATG